MAIYVVVGNFTQKGMQTIKERSKQLKEFQEIIEPWGVKVKALYYTMGRFDIVGIVEAPSDDVMTKCLLQIGRREFVRTETLKAILPDELAEITKGLP